MRSRSRPASFLALSAAALLLSSCGAASTRRTGASSAPSRQTRVTISGYAFHAGVTPATVGSRISFVNRDNTPHTATAAGGAFDTGTLRPGRTRSVVLHRPGTYVYYCQFHAFMRATIVVH